MLTVKFSDNSSHVYTDFSLASDNLSLIGHDLFAVGATNLTNPGGLQRGDFALINAATATVPEPASVAIFSCCLGALPLFRRKRLV